MTPELRAKLDALLDGKRAPAGWFPWDIRGTREEWRKVQPFGPPLIVTTDTPWTDDERNTAMLDAERAT